MDSAGYFRARVCDALQVIEREREIAGMEVSHRAAVSLLEEQLLNAECRLARESEQSRSLEHRYASNLL